MKTLVTLLSGIALLMIATARADTEEGKEVKLADLPKAVQTTVNEHASGGTVEKILETTKDGQKVYRVNVRADGKKESFTVDAQGKFLQGDDNHNKRKGHDKAPVQPK